MTHNCQLFTHPSVHPLLQDFLHTLFTLNKLWNQEIAMKLLTVDLRLTGNKELNVNTCNYLYKSHVINGSLKAFGIKIFLWMQTDFSQT